MVKVRIFNITVNMPANIIKFNGIKTLETTSNNPKAKNIIKFRTFAIKILELFIKSPCKDIYLLHINFIITYIVLFFANKKPCLLQQG